MTSPSFRNATAVSAPGKVLLAGGYLVTDRAHTGLVLGLSARIHVYVRALEASDDGQPKKVVVQSPQFRDSEWRYGYRVLEDNKGVEVFHSEGYATDRSPRNKFIEVALSYALSYVWHSVTSRLFPLQVIILADSNYYSQSTTMTRCKKNPESQFLDFNIKLAHAHKTGLGSSAALVSAFVSGLLRYYFHMADKDICADTFKTRAHNLSQVAHCAAQGKIGSGFDVAAAVYGSCVYRRFSPSILTKVGETGSSGFSANLKAVIDDQTDPRIWDTQVDEAAVGLPEQLRLVMCDVDCGSESPGMVAKITAWKKEFPDEAALLWKRIQQGVDELIAELQRLSRELNRPLDTLRAIILNNRSQIREMSAKSHVPIEPNVQSELIDACSSIQGVVGGVVPGAGGYDAIVLIVENREEVVRDLQSLLENFRSSSAQSGEFKIERVRMLDVKQENQGLKVEPIQQYAGWV